MFKVTFIRLRDIIKCIAIVIAIYFFGKFIFKYSSEKNNLKSQVNLNIDNFLKYGVSSESSIIENVINKEADKYEEKKESKKNTKDIALKEILQIGKISFKENEKIEEVINTADIDEAINTEEENKEEKKQEDTADEKNVEKVAEIETGIILDNAVNSKTEVITKNPIKESYNEEYKGVKIKNETSFELTEDILNPVNLSIDTNNIIIFHTHTCESYTQSSNYQYNPTGNFRTTDLNYSVAKVGDELTKNLTEYGFNVHHNKDYHDYPAYTGSYTRSLSTVSTILKNFNADIIIDLHRDAIGSKSDYAPAVKIGEDECAQVMFVMGTNGGGLNHPNWNQNLKFAVKIQEVANEIYPNFFKPIILRNSRYNQHLGKAACIIEVGATGNTLDQTLNSMKYLSYIMKQALR